MATGQSVGMANGFPIIAVALWRPSWRRPMPKGPRGERRPGDVVDNAVKVVRIAMGEIEDEREAASSAAAQLGKLGGAARARSLTAEQRAEIDRKAAAGQWKGRAPD